MNDFEAQRPSVVAVAGDWHANSSYAREAIRHAKRRGAEAILHVGDFAFDMRESFHRRPSFLDHVQEALEETGLILGWVDGNHDNHTTLAGLVDEHGYTAIPVRPDVYYLPRGYRWAWRGTRFLALGGAHSVDRPWRRAHVEWWPGETISSADAFRVCEGGPADIMICHDVPAGVRIPCIEGNPAGFPEQEIKAAERNRRVLREIVSVVRPKRIFSGHYHCRLTTELIGTNYATLVDILDMDGRPFEDNTTTLDL